MKWVIRVAAGLAIGGAIVSEAFTGHQFPQLGRLIFAVLLCVGLYEGIFQWGHNDDDEPPGPFRPA